MPLDLPTNSSDIVKEATALLGGGLIGTLARDVISWIRGSKKDAAEAEMTIADAQTRYLKEFRDTYADRVTDLTNEIHQLRDKLELVQRALDEQQRAHAAQLLAQQSALADQMAAQQRYHSEQMAAQQQNHEAQMQALRLELTEARQMRGLGV
jgi:chromosome segregation ATPase